MRFPVLALLLASALAHATAKKPDGLSWMDWHMQEEHELDQYDADTFFVLHDLESKGYWDESDLLYIYGLTRDEMVGDGSGMGEHSHNEAISQQKKDQVVLILLKALDADKSRQVSQAEWAKFVSLKGQLPDLGVGPGHHMDFETEYENHHWNQYHRDQDPDVHIKHKEDIEHELLHHMHEIDETHDRDPAARKVSSTFSSPVNPANVPQKYLAQT